MFDDLLMYFVLFFRNYVPTITTQMDGTEQLFDAMGGRDSLVNYQRANRV